MLTKTRRQDGNATFETPDGSTILHVFAQYKKKASTIQRLLEVHNINVNALNNSNSTPLHLAAEHGTVEVVNFLINAGANVNAVDNNNSTPLHLAITSKSSPEIVIRLLQCVLATLLPLKLPQELNELVLNYLVGENTVLYVKQCLTSTPVVNKYLNNLFFNYPHKTAKLRATIQEVTTTLSKLKIR